MANFITVSPFSFVLFIGQESSTASAVLRCVFSRSRSRLGDTSFNLNSSDIERYDKRRHNICQDLCELKA